MHINPMSLTTYDVVLTTLTLLLVVILACLHYLKSTPDDQMLLFGICARSYNTRQSLEILRDDIRSYWLSNQLTPEQQLQARDLIYYIDARLLHKQYTTE